MARKSACVEMVGGKSPRQRIWETIRSVGLDCDETFTQQEIEHISKVDESMVKDYFKALLKAGFITVFNSEVVKGICKRNYYQLKTDNGIEAPRIDKKGALIEEGSGNERMWGTIRRLFVNQSFNYRELAAFASTATNLVSDETAKSYVSALYSAGYLECTVPAVRGHKAKPASYRLMPNMNSGRRAPMIQRTKRVFDPNWNRVVWTEEKEIDDEQ
ncbi:hypothetical protein [Undibacterium danionis]|uniref:Uncharacterized protein n=1 Tax=Undibacterium danionis TaxID=1812100 RepID=A0ABV6IDN4_9BURK